MVTEESAAPVRLSGWLLMTLGLLGITLGPVWTLQGLNLLQNDMMSDSAAWATAGGILTVAGLLLVVIGMRRRTRAKRS